MKNKSCSKEDFFTDNDQQYEKIDFTKKIITQSKEPAESKMVKKSVLMWSNQALTNSFNT